MRYYWQTLCLTLWSAAAGSTLAVQAQSPLENPQIVGALNEQPGSRIQSYNSRELALQEEDKESLYLRSLNGEWRVKHFQEAVALDSTMAAVELDDSAWEKVSIPEKEGNGAWATVYRRVFTMPFKWIDREVFVRLDAVSRAYTVYANGHPVGYHADSKTPAYFDITRYVADGKNTITVIAYAHPVSEKIENRNLVKGTAIEGEVTVMAQPKVRIRDFVVDTRFSPEGNGLFSFGAIVKSHLLNPKEVNVYYELIAPDDSTVISHGKRDARFRLRLEDTVRFFANLPNIENWSYESPKLYTVALRLQHEGRFTEYTKVKVGFRTVEYDTTGMRINGVPVTLYGVDYALPREEEQWRRDLADFRKRGINFLRIADNPASDRFYTLADQYGIYLCNRANLDARQSGGSLQRGGTPANDTLWASAYTDRVMNMYYTSQTHPSILMFELGGEAGRGYGMYEAYLRLKAEETERPVIYESAGAQWNTDMVVGTPEGRNASDTRFTLHFASSESTGEAGNPVAQSTILEAPGIGKFELFNGCMIADLRNFRVGYTITSGSKQKLVAEGICPVALAPQQRTTVQVPLEGVKPGKYTLTIYLAYKDSEPVAPSGERIVERSFPLVVPKPPKK
ncbi:MAG: glycoside hydrolase family 2 TIM barrel-domain containing protein [Alistipes sp.]|nr:glycoside hydrolase family 2 TIM barrel-domain containing protein [Alistipes sp.]